MSNVVAVLSPHGLHLPRFTAPGTEWHGVDARVDSSVPSEDEDLASTSEVEPEDAEIMHLVGSVTTERSFVLSWTALSGAVRNAALDARTPAQINFTRQFIDCLSNMLTPPLAAGATVTCSVRTVAASVLAQLRHDARSGFDEHLLGADDDVASAFPIPIAPPLRAMQNAPPTVFHLIEDHILTGNCNTRENTLNCKQALFLVVFGIALHVSWLHVTGSLYCIFFRVTRYLSHALLQ